MCTACQLDCLIIWVCKRAHPLSYHFVLSLNDYYPAWEKFLNFHGQRGARLGADQNIFERDDAMTGRSVLFHLVSIFLFFRSQHYMDQLNKIWVDRMVRQRAWDKFITTCLKDWKHALTPVSK